PLRSPPLPLPDALPILTIQANESASLSFPTPSLRATSQPKAALTRTTSADAMARRTVGVSFALSLLHHSTTCVSSSSFTACGSRSGEHTYELQSPDHLV